MEHAVMSIRHASCSILLLLGQGFVLLCGMMTSHVSAQGQTLPFHLGLNGGISRQFPAGGLAALQGVEPFPALLDTHNGTGLEGGIEALYRLNSRWEVGLRGQYAQFSATTRGEGSTLIGVNNPLSAIPTPTRFPLQTTLFSDVQMLSFTPLVRLFFGDIFFVSAGLKIDVPVRSSLRARFDLVAPPSATFVANGAQSLEAVLPDTTARVGFSWSPVVSVGAALSLGRVRFMPELQVQPLFQTFRGLAPNRTAWNLPSVRLNLGVILSFPDAPSSKNTPSADTAVTIPRTAFQTLPHQSTAPTASMVQPLNTTDTAIAITLPTTRIDTVFQRDTTTRFIAWNSRDSVRLTRTSAQIVTAPNGQQMSIMESYQHDVPKPKPFLVATIDVRFIPALGASRTTESKEASRLVEKPTIVRSLWASPEKPHSSGAQNDVFTPSEAFDTLSSVRLPLIRFASNVSTEVGLARQHITIASEASQNAPLIQIPYRGRKPFDWDAQALLFPETLRHFGEILDDSIPHHTSQFRTTPTRRGDTLLAWLKVTDNEAQDLSSDTVRITVAHSEQKPPINETQIFKTNARQAARWTLVHLQLKPDNEKSRAEYAFSPRSTMLLEHFAKDFLRQKTLAKAAIKNATVYADVAGDADELALESLQRLVRSVAEKLNISTYHVLLRPTRHFADGYTESVSKKNHAFPLADAYIRVMIEE
jgi:hypothetical protein